jgi:cardiolipin synthase A/B
MKPMKSRKRRVVRVLLLLLATLAISYGVHYWFSRKPIRKEIQVEYSVADPAFRRSIDGLLGTPFAEGNEVKTLVNGDEIFPAMLQAINSARKTITYETYIWSQGKICDQFKKALSERAKAGVKVHVVVDGMGSIKLRQADINDLQDAGVNIVKFNRDQWYKVNFQINHRTHRKVLVVDGRIGFIGGSCLHDSWLGNAETEKQWRDTHFRIEGPAVAQLQGIFMDNWRQTTGEVLQGEDYFPELKPVGDLPVQGYMCGPKDNQESIRLATLFALSAAQTNIRIAHAYFVPDDLMMKTLLSARQRGVEIEIIVPGKIDSKLVKAASRSSWGKLMNAGVKFHEYGPAMYHVKEMIIDDIFVMAGSANFDNRSFRINDEANFNVLDARFAAEQIRIFENDKKSGRPLTMADLKKRSVFTKTTDHVASIFSSQF